MTTPQPDTPSGTSETSQDQPHPLQQFSSPSQPSSIGTPAGSYTSSPFSASSAGGPPPHLVHENTADHLRYLTREIVTALRNLRANPSAGHWVFEHFDPNFKSNTHHNEKEYVTGVDNYLAEPQQYLEKFPDIKIEVLEPYEVNVDEKAGRATVFLTFEVSNAPPPIVRQNMAIIEWKLGKDKWLLTKLTGMRGFGDLGLP